MDNSFNSLNSLDTSTTALGIAGLLSNFGCRYLPMELSDECCEILKHPISRKIIMIASVFLITKNIKLSLQIVIIVSLICSIINKLSNKKKINQNDL